MPAWVKQGYDEYAKRIGPEMSLVLTEVAAEKRTKTTDTKRLLEKEMKKIQQAMPANSYVIALDKTGQSWSTEKLAQQMDGWLQMGQNICFLIGGPEGLTREMVQQADMCLSFSAMTFPHPLMRVIVAEQLYRASSVLKNHPYHK